MSKYWALRRTLSVRTNPGYSETTAILNFSASCAISAVILSTAALAAPYATFAIYFCAAQKDIFTIRPFLCAVITLAARALATYAARTPPWNIASQRQKGCAQKGLSQVNSPPC